MPSELTTLKFKLVVGILIIPLMKILLALILVAAPLQKFFCEAGFMWLKMLQGSATSSTKLQLCARLINGERFWVVVVLFAHFVVVVGSGFCSIYRCVTLLTHPETLRSRELIAVEADVTVIVSCVSLIFHVLPIILIQELFYITLLTLGQLGIELAIFKQFNQLIRVIYLSDEELHAEYLEREEEANRVYPNLYHHNNY